MKLKEIEMYGFNRELTKKILKDKNAYRELLRERLKQLDIVDLYFEYKDLVTTFEKFKKDVNQKLDRL